MADRLLPERVLQAMDGKYYLASPRLQGKQLTVELRVLGDYKTEAEARRAMNSTGIRKEWTFE